jgi:glycogen phosphorylase
MRGRLAMVFVPNYGVSLAERIIPASDISIQISTAGTEASGTSNMKLAMNGALTIGTLDGANVEIRDAVGRENFFLFGLSTPEVAALRQSGYDPMPYILQSPALSETLDLIASGFFSLGDEDRYKPIVDHLKARDHYMVCADFDAYVAAEARAAQCYRDPRDWARRSLFNIVGASAFSSDNTVRQYAQEIWGIQPVKTDLSVVPLALERVPPESTIIARSMRIAPE